MKAKIIELIKKYRAESKKHWTGYDHAVACNNHADDLEELLKEKEKE